VPEVVDRKVSVETVSVRLLIFGAAGFEVVAKVTPPIRPATSTARPIRLVRFFIAHTVRIPKRNLLPH
jgi:hypothetical protein